MATTHDIANEQRDSAAKAQQVRVIGGNSNPSEIKTVRATNNNSTTRATALTPASGKKVRVVSVNIAFEGGTSNGLEVYFDDGANIGTNAGKEITEAHQSAIGPVFESWPDGAGPIGGADEVVSIRGTALVTEDVNLILVYREE